MAADLGSHHSPNPGPMIGLSPSERTFIENFIETGDLFLACAISNTQPSLVRSPHIQSALVEYIREMGAADAIYARKTLIDLAKSADLDSVRLRAAQTLWERGLGKVPDQIDINIHDQSTTREALYAEIHNLISEIGLPPLIEGEGREVVPHAELQSADPHKTQAGVAQEEEPPAAPPPAPPSRDDTASSAVAGSYTPELPTKWR